MQLPAILAPNFVALVADVLFCEVVDAHHSTGDGASSALSKTCRCSKHHEHGDEQHT